MSESDQVTVIGSLNVDHFARVDRLPRQGGTVAANRLDVYQGGKGANQAIASARQGNPVLLIGALGTDPSGTAYRKALKSEGFDTSTIKSARTSTGTALVAVNSEGENTIITASGANNSLTPADVRKHSERIAKSGAILIQFEIPLPPILEAARIANRNGIPLIINPSPGNSAFPWQEMLTEFAIVNERESTELLGFDLFPFDHELVHERLHDLRIRNLIVTRGADETLVYRIDGELLVIPALPVVPIDTVGAGDAFAGCFAARIASGESLANALHAANCAGALATLGLGAQGPIPNREKVDQHLQHLKNHY